jgi:dTDP-4-dehydrorhamnose 3,5-epimerase
VSSRFEISDTLLEALKVIRRKPVGDHRGYLERLFCTEDLCRLMNGTVIRQINHTVTAKRGAVRGMHFQFQPHAESKIVSCLRGEVFDVAVDVRSGSKTFLHWHAEVLSGSNHTSLFVPEGFAHGFQTLTEECEMLYFHTAPWHPGAEGGLNPRDPALNIAWPITVTEVSARDASHPMLTNEFAGVTL